MCCFPPGLARGSAPDGRASQSTARTTSLAPLPTRIPQPDIQPQLRATSATSTASSTLTASSTSTTTVKSATPKKSPTKKPGFADYEVEVWSTDEDEVLLSTQQTYLGRPITRREAITLYGILQAIPCKQCERSGRECRRRDEYLEPSMREGTDANRKIVGRCDGCRQHGKSCSFVKGEDMVEVEEEVARREMQAEKLMGSSSSSKSGEHSNRSSAASTSARKRTRSTSSNGIGAEDEDIDELADTPPPFLPATPKRHRSHSTQTRPRVPSSRRSACVSKRKSRVTIHSSSSSEDGRVGPAAFTSPSRQSSSARKRIKTRGQQTKQAHTPTRATKEASTHSPGSGLSQSTQVTRLVVTPPAEQSLRGRTVSVHRPASAVAVKPTVNRSPNHNVPLFLPPSTSSPARSNASNRIPSPATSPSINRVVSPDPSNSMIRTLSPGQLTEITRTVSLSRSPTTANSLSFIQNHPQVSARQQQRPVATTMPHHRPLSPSARRVQLRSTVTGSAPSNIQPHMISLTMQALDALRKLKANSWRPRMWYDIIDRWTENVREATTKEKLRYVHREILESPAMASRPDEMDETTRQEVRQMFQFIHDSL